MQNIILMGTSHILHKFISLLWTKLHFLKLYCTSSVWFFGAKIWRLLQSLVETWRQLVQNKAKAKRSKNNKNKNKSPIDTGKIKEMNRIFIRLLDQYILLSINKMSTLLIYNRIKDSCFCRSLRSVRISYYWKNIYLLTLIK